MALSEVQRETIRLEISKGTSGRRTAQIAKCSEKAVRSLIKAEGLEKGALQKVAEVEVSTIIMQKSVKEQKDAVKRRKDAFSDDQLDAYETVLDEAKKTHQIAEGFQEQIIKRQQADSMAIDALVVFKAQELKKAKTPEDVLAVEMKFREYLSMIADYDEMKKGVEANDKASITLGINDRHPPKVDSSAKVVVINNDTEDDKGMF